MRVSVVILCYNLENYIKRAIEGVLMQKVDFELEVIVCNDGSTDESESIIKKYPIKFINHLENRGLIASRIETFDSCTGEYIAMCDGDDYWTDAYKLQKQVDFMQDNPRCGLVHTGFEILDESKNEYIKVIRPRIPEGRMFEALMFNNKISSCTALFRRKYWLEIDRKEYNKLNGSEDRFLWMHIAQKSDIGYIKDITATYTKRKGSMTGRGNAEKQSQFVEESFDIRYYFADQYECSVAIKKLLYKRALDIADLIKNESMAKKASERLKKVI